MIGYDKGLRVLIVDDNRDGADTLGVLIEELGNQVRVTYGGRQALEIAATFRPDLMLVDLMMPDVNGCELVTRLRQSTAFARTRIVAVTGQKTDTYKNMAMKAGCDEILLKPTTLTEIEAILAVSAAANQGF